MGTVTGHRCRPWTWVLIPPFAALLVAACGAGDPVADPATAAASFNAEDCPEGAGEMHSDYSEGFDTPEQAAEVAADTREVPDGDLVLVSDSGQRRVFVVVDDAGRAVAELPVEPFGDDTWVVSDLTWCRWPGDIEDETVVNTDGD